MIPEKYAELVTGWLDGTLTPARQEELERCIDEGLIDRAELDELAHFYVSMESTQVPEPDRRMSDRFYAMLETYKNISTAQSANSFEAWWNRLLENFRFPRFAYALVLVLLGFAGGMLIHMYAGRDREVEQLADQVRSMREMMVVTLLEQPSSFDRLKAVNISTDISQADNKVIEALLNALNTDPNVNVRMAAIDALVHHAANPLAREGLINSIDRQNSPLVQLTIADAMVSLKEKKAVPDLRKLLNRENLNPQVKKKIETSITQLL